MDPGGRFVTAARIRAYSQDGGTLLGVLPTIAGTLQFSVERGGMGGCSFTCLTADLDTLGARDSLIRVELETAPDTWVAVAAYCLRPPFRRDRVLGPETQCTATAVLQTWAGETVILPEYTLGDIPPGAGTDRGVGWMSTAYDPDADPNEAWGGAYEGTRTTFPTVSNTTGQPWPTGTGAAWISITGATDATERKMFRTSSAAPLTITTAGPVRVHIASDSRGTFYVASEPFDVTGGEPGKEPIVFDQWDMWMEPGEYACAMDTESLWDTGGDGWDPIIVAICTLVDGDPDEWLLVSNETDWVACRRDADPPDNEPPGPTPGAMLAYLVAEAQAREASGWAGVTLGFDAVDDSYAVAWPESATMIERMTRYGADTYLSLFNMIAEAEADIWMGPDLVLHAAPVQGDTSPVVTLENTDDPATSHIATMTDTTAKDPGSWACALTLQGWVTPSTFPTPRREYGLELGTAISRAVGARVLLSSLVENGRWDGSIRLAPAAPVPLVEFDVGDTIGITYGSGVPADVQVLTVSASTGESGDLLWDLEVVEFPS